ncbi:ABC transporter substrate-binding protein [Actinopolymorpha pittospori]|uniref:Peptide/nickel transport system substrate-binding protein n=1 Tax=Actinopolymorpha pittospori TaxID=648752 RepID=A0A927MUY2_9ACTN|nr:ABC transporter substrate-binding protein [Actinopolymorpha pittospori]MBE1607104.1 peptide/nickel transport system substrate-binding protein [Actinopolymorpha pittospori]
MATRNADGRGISRKNFLRAGGALGLLALGVPGCDLLSTDPQGRGQTGDGGAGGGADAAAVESPKLASQVKNGKLPALKDRLPAKPVVVEPVDRAGQYGGEWHTALQGSADSSWARRILSYDYLLRWDLEWKQMLPNLAGRFEANADGTEYTFVLREGIKWSDGKPFTADDIVFAQNDVLNNTELFPVAPWPGHAERVDDLTVRIALDRPDGLFLQRQCTDLGQYLIGYPRHYLQRFHLKYSPDVAEQAKAERLEDWAALFGTKADPLLNVDLPVLSAWKFTRPANGGTRAVAERNPYYWKVDPDGRQLPYIDQVSFEVISDVQVMVTKAIAGDFDMHCRHFNSLTNKPVLARGRTQGDYDFFNLRSGSMNHTLIQLNQTHKDPVLRKIFQNKSFRIGLSHAINRQEIIDTAFQKQGRPWQAAPRPESELFDEEMATQYTKYDVSLANRTLDEAGYARRDGNGRRLRPDGKPIAFSLEFSAELRPEWADTAQLLTTYWKAVGITASAQPRSRALWVERVEANEHDVVIWQGDQGGFNMRATILEPFYFFPQTTGSRYGIRWAEWYATRGKSGEEPLEPNRRQMALYDQILATTDQDRQATLIKEILAIAKEQFQIIGVGLEANGYGIVKSHFHNVPAEMIDTYTIQTPGPSHPEQYFIQS